MLYLGILFLVSVVLTNSLFKLKNTNALYVGIIPFAIFLAFQASWMALAVWFVFTILAFVAMVDLQSRIDEKILALSGLR